MGRSIISLTALLLLVPAVAAQDLAPGIYNPYESTETTLYFHLSGMQDAMINTQKPDDRYYQASGLGMATHTACVEDPTGSQTFTQGDHHTYYATSTPSIVQYDVDEGGEPRAHPERGISYDVEFDPDEPLMFTWYLETQWFAGESDDADPNTVPAVVPDVVVRATMREGDAISVDHETLNNGELIAQAESAPTLLAAEQTDNPDQVTYHRFGDKHLYEFRFPMEFEQTAIPAEESFNMRVDIFVENPYCTEPEDENSLMPDLVRVHTSTDHRPRLEFNIMNPLVIEALHPMIIGDELAIHTGSNSPWGNYDVMGDNPADPLPMQLDIEGPSQALSVEQAALVAHYGGHHRHTEAVSATWLWDFTADQAAPGLYTITLTIQNDQETAEATAVSTFQIGNDGGVQSCAKNFDDEDVVCTTGDEHGAVEEAPAVAPLALLAALAGVAALLRRR